MGVVNLPSGTYTREINVNGISVSVASGTTLSLILDGSVSGWNPNPIIEETQYRRKIQFLRNDNKALMRYEIDKEGPHLHYEKNGFRIKVHIPQLDKIDFQEFAIKFPELKEKGNGIIKSLKREKKKDKASEHM